MTITPLDTCGRVVLDGEKYQKVLKRKSAITSNLLENYRMWFRDGLRDRKDLNEADLDRLTDEKLNQQQHDAVRHGRGLPGHQPGPGADEAAAAFASRDDGFTRVEDGAKRVDCAVKWKSLDGYESWLVERLVK